MPLRHHYGPTCQPAVLGTFAIIIMARTAAVAGDERERFLSGPIKERRN
jgi:hypothetical protein